MDFSKGNNQKVAASGKGKGCLLPTWRPATGQARPIGASVGGNQCCYTGVRVRPRGA